MATQWQKICNKSMGIIDVNDIQNESRQHNRQQSRVKQRGRKFNENTIEKGARLWYSIHGQRV